MKAVVLLSGGIDSTTCLALAIEKFGNKEVTALSLSYGQKHVKELKSAEEVAKYYDVPVVFRDLSEAFAMSDCSLLKGQKDIEYRSYAEQIKESKTGVISTYVPFRNGLFISFAAVYALSIGAEYVFYGAHADDAAGNAYPDCSPEFFNSMNSAVRRGSDFKVTLEAPFLYANKKTVVKTGLLLNTPYHLTWSCYEGKEKACGTCGTCIDRKAAFEANGTTDPIEYLK